MGMKPYVVKQGEYLSKLAFRMGFDPDQVWGDASNADLKKTRASGDILLAGDVLYVPDQPPKKLSFKKGQANAYSAKLRTVSVKIALTGPGGAPRKNEPFIVRGLGGDDLNGTTDGDGNVKFDAPVTVRQVELELPNKKQKYRVSVGDLDPVNEKAGAKSRLEHLGFYGATFATGSDGTYASRDDGLLAAALKAFQVKSQLPLTGLLDDATQAALVAAHGS
jgi:hypothetical protein